MKKAVEGSFVSILAAKLGLNLTARFILIIFLASGITCLYAAEHLEELTLLSHFLDKTGTALLSGACIIYLEHRFFSIHEKELLKSELLEIVPSKAEIANAVEQAIKDNTLSSKEIEGITESVLVKRDSVYELIKTSGITSVNPSFEVTRVLNEMLSVKNTKIRICVIFLPFCERVVRVLHDCIVMNGCTVEVLLCDPTCSDPLRKRKNAVNADLSDSHYPQTINRNIKEFEHLSSLLPAPYKSKITVKLHRSFIGASLWGFGETYWVGSYLADRTATEGSNIRVQGSHSFLFQEYRNHFKKEWSRAHKTLDLEKNGLKANLNGILN